MSFCTKNKNMPAQVYRTAFRGSLGNQARGKGAQGPIHALGRNKGYSLVVF